MTAAATLASPPPATGKAAARPPVQRKYSKSSAFYRHAKSDYIEQNARLLAEELGRNRVYTEQPLRRGCKICGTAMPEAADFSSHGVDYKLCRGCGHLNGRHEETQAFVDALYVGDGVAQYATDYLDDNFARRTSDIYRPKAEFLRDSLGDTSLKVLDVGCGSGYFVHACHQLGMQARGVDVSREMVDFGNRQIVHLGGTAALRHVQPHDFVAQVVDTDADVVSAIGVIEHLQNPHELFAAFGRSQASVLYYSVPMFSSSVLFENLFKDVYPRQLAGGHTHLFTETSLERMHLLCGVEPVAEWRFGADMLDLHRAMLSGLSANGASAALLQVFEAGFGAHIDELQACLDRAHFCSEIHCVARKRVPG